ncbi:hypothetical protein D1872_50900 [compost metagenome]
MGKGVTSTNRKKLNELRGRKAKEAEDARKLAQTSILHSAQNKAFSQDIYVPSDVPEDIAKIMKDNALENATVVFGHNALQLFSYVFGQAVNAAVAEAMKDMEKTIEDIIDRKAIETVNLASGSLVNLLNLIKSPVEGLTSLGQEENKVVPLRPIEEEVGNNDNNRILPRPTYRENTHSSNILSIIRECHPSSITVKEITASIAAQGLKAPHSVHHELYKLCQAGWVKKSGRGTYIYIT